VAFLVPTSRAAITVVRRLERKWGAIGHPRLLIPAKKLIIATKPIFSGRRQLIEAPPTPSATTAYWATLKSEAILEAWFGDNG
jgi:hypothetical protein